mmetsp:Transcript_67947/g.196797  ORF Transcript_67947/g.196797 Transcript_67947/m.196797 type:complete len:895 (-) Transcript_67947:157-2841(-)
MAYILFLQEVVQAVDSAKAVASYSCCAANASDVSVSSEASEWANVHDIFLNMSMDMVGFCTAWCIYFLVNSSRKWRRPAQIGAKRRQGGAAGCDTRPKRTLALTAIDLLRYAREGRSKLPVELEGLLTPEALAEMVEECETLKSPSEKIEAATWVHRVFAARHVRFFSATYKRLIAIYAYGDEKRGRDCLHQLLGRGRALNARFCRLVMWRSVERKCLGLAVDVADHLWHTQGLDLQSFKCLLKVYAAANMYERACSIYPSMLEAGIEPDVVTYGNLILCAQMANNQSLAQELAERSKCKGYLKSVLWSIRSAGLDGKLEKAIEEFRLIKFGISPEVDTKAYNIILDACCSNKDVDRALEFFEDMEKKGVKRNRITFNTMMKGYCILGQVEQLQDMMDRMRKSGHEPDRASFTCLLGCFVRKLDLENAWRVFYEIDRLGFVADSHIVAIMMRLSSNSQTAHEAEKALSILDRPDVVPCLDVCAMKAALEACVCAKAYERLDRIISGYMRRRSEFKGCAYLFGLLIKGCKTLGSTRRAWEIWSIMLEEIGAPTEVVLGCMIDALIEGYEIEDALALFHEWKGSVKCDTITYSMLMKGFARIFDANRALELFRTMQANGVPRNHIVYTSLLTACSRAGFIDHAERILLDMRQDGCSPNAITYSVMINGHCQAGNMSAAVELMQSMTEAGMRPDCVIYNTLLGGCVRHSEWDLADTLLADMEKKAIAHSNITISTIVRMWSRRGCLENAIKTVYDALGESSACDPAGRRVPTSIVDAQVGSELLGACIHNGAYERAFEIFQDFKKWPNFDGPNGHAYNTIITGLVKYGNLHEGVRIAEESIELLRVGYRSRNTVDKSTMVQLFRALRKAELIEELGKPLYDKLVSVNFSVDETWISC